LKTVTVPIIRSQSGDSHGETRHEHDKPKQGDR
jgi:hypothetical protein